MGNPTNELRAKLDELGVEYDTYDLPNGEHGVSWIDGNGIEWEAVQRGENFEIHALQLVTPEQAIAATVGKDNDEHSRTSAELSKRLREVYGLHAFAELFGFNWTDDSDWTWHDVACAMADAVDAVTAGSEEPPYDELIEALRRDWDIDVSWDGLRKFWNIALTEEGMRKRDAATVGNAREPSNAVIERIERFCTDYAHCLMDSTILVKRNYESMDLRAVKKAEVVEDRLIRELAEYIATVGKDIECYDGSGRRGTVAILQGGRKPEEVLFVRYEGGVTHYLPEGTGTCHMEVHDNLLETEGMGEVWLECDKCHWQMPLEPTTPRFKYCPNCRARIKEETE